MSPGTQVGAYRIVKQIGEGGMGSVWLAEHAMLGRRAAVKLLHPSYSSHQEIVQRFFNEARAATSISDPGIVQIFDFGNQPDGQAYIVMELLEGEPLDTRLERQGRLPIDETLRIMRQVASSLGAAHARGIVHRDLKPENIFMVRDPEVVGGERAKLLDFGIAKLGEQSGVQTQTNMIMGTPAYMSPEQCRGAKHIDARSDVYALGCVMFTLLTGRPPFTAEGHGDWIVMHITQPAPRLASVLPHASAMLDQLVAKCLEKDPNARFANGAELAGALNQLVTHMSQPGMPIAAHAAVTIAAKPQTTLRSAAAQSAAVTGKQSSTLAIVGGLVVLLAIGGGIAFYATRDKGEPDGQAQASAPTPMPPKAEPPKPEPLPPPSPAPAPPEPSPPAEAKPETVDIRIESNPSGAAVFVAEEKVPRGKTPYTLSIKKSDPAIEIKLVATGYAPKKAKVSPATDTSIAVPLTKARRGTTATQTPSSPVSDDSDETMNPFNKKK
ncbi:MAG TPA: serine/threonine-protein kinase [Kofleriaceae bacterium]|nr:serine/threonine-protein kinase [Kofleriaceae bacterium]